MKKFASVLFNTPVKALNYDGNLYTFINVILNLLLNHNKYLKGISVYTNMITVLFLQDVYIFYMILDTLKEWGRKVNKKDKIMNKISRKFRKE